MFWKVFKVFQLGERDDGLDVYSNFSKVDIKTISNVLFFSSNGNSVIRPV